MAYSLPLRPFLMSGPRVFDEEDINTVPNTYTASLTLSRHHQRLSLNVTACSVSRPVDSNATYKTCPSLELWAPTAFPDQNALLCTPLHQEASKMLLPYNLKVSPSGFGYPLGEPSNF
jgi:hypothetical protein